MYFLWYSDLIFLNMDFSFMLFTSMGIKHGLFCNLGEYFWYMSVSWACMYNYLTWVQDKLHLGFKSLFCNLTGCFDSLLSLKHLWKWKQFSHLLSIAQLFWALPKTGIHHLQRNVRRCQDVDLSFLSFPCKWDSIVKMTEDSSWKEAPSKMSELHDSMSCNWHINKCSFMLDLTSSQQLDFWTKKLPNS